MYMVQLNTNQNCSQNFASDRALAQSAASGDQRSQRIVISQVLPRVSRTISYLIPNPECAADVRQLSLIRILQTVHTYRGNSSLSYWASRVASTTALNYLQKKARRKVLWSVAPPPVDHHASADDQAGLVWAKDLLQKMLARLPEEQRSVVVLRHIEGFSVEEISSIVGAGHNTVRQRLRAGNAKLRDQVKRHPGLKSFVLGRLT